MGEQQYGWEDVENLVIAIGKYRFWREQWSRDYEETGYPGVREQMRANLEEAADGVRRAIRAVTTGTPDVPIAPIKEEAVGRDKANEPVA